MAYGRTSGSPRLFWAIASEQALAAYDVVQFPAMHRWQRLVARPAAVLSLLVCAATAILWVRSYRTMDEMFLIYKGEGSEELSSLYGQVRFKHTLPRSGTREGVARISHRTNRVLALPPRPWAEDRLKARWVVFRYDDSIYDVKRLARAQAAVQAYMNYRIQPASALDGLTPDQIQAEQKRLAQLTAAYLAAQPVLNNARPESYWAVAFPMWLLMLPAALLVPVAWLISSLRRALRSKAGLCRPCGYDLTGNTSGVCPECGANVAQITAVAPAV